MFDPYNLYSSNQRSSRSGQILRKRPTKTFNLNDFQKMIKILKKNGYYIYEIPPPVSTYNNFYFPINYITSYSNDYTLTPNFSIKLYQVLDNNGDLQHFIEQHKRDPVEEFSITVILNMLNVNSTYVTRNSTLSVSSRFISDIYDYSNSLIFTNVELTQNNYSLVTSGDHMHCDFGTVHKSGNNHLYSNTYTDVPKHDDTKPNYALSYYYDNQKALWEGLCIDGSTPLPWANDILITMEYAVNSETSNVSTLHTVILSGVINIRYK